MIRLFSILLAICVSVPLFLAEVAMAQGEKIEVPPLAARHVYSIRMSDGVDIAVAVYLPPGKGRFPALLAASPYRFDNDQAPPVPIFTFRETGPIAWYLEHGYAFVRLDVRGTGRSGGEWHFQDKREQRDLYEAVEWIAKQPWSNQKVGGIGQSAYGRSQWSMAVEAPPHLSCIAPYDAHVDTYRSSAYTGGIFGTYINWWSNNVRNLNQTPFAGVPRRIPWDYSYNARQHPLYDAFWRERSVVERLPHVKIPVFSIGVWGKTDLALNGNIIGYQRVGGPKKLLVLGGAGVDAAVAEYASIAFHERYMLPFYDWCLKGRETSYVREPQVRYTVTGSNEVRTAQDWPPHGIKYKAFYLSAIPSHTVASLNDGSLTDVADTNGGSTILNYPNAAWSITGVVAKGQDGKLDPARKVLTFTSAPITRDTVIAGPSTLHVSFSSSRADADFFVKLYEQMPQKDDDRHNNIQPQARLLTKGWLRASHRAIDPKESRDYAPWYKDTAVEPLQPGKLYTVDIAIMPTAAMIHAGSRVRLEIANSDSMLVEGIFAHSYSPDQVGSYTIYHSVEHPTELFLPIEE